MPDLKPLALATLNPPMNITLVVDGAGLEKVGKFFSRITQGNAVPKFGTDTETNCTNDFFLRRIRTLQVGDRDEQFVIDLLPFAGSEDKLVESQGFYGKNNGKLFAPILAVLEPYLCSNKALKVGQNLSFDYEVIHWNLGKRIWHLYSTDLAERVIQAGGRISLKQYKEFSMVALMSRYFNVLIDKTEQSTFDLKSPLTQSQIEYAAFDIRSPLAIREAQMKILLADQLLTTTQLEDDALPTFVDMHLVGQGLDKDRWVKRLENTKARRAEELKFLDEAFIPVVGRKCEAIDQAALDARELVWRKDFEQATPEEMTMAAAARIEKDPTAKAAFKEKLAELVSERKARKAVARAVYMEAKRDATAKKKILEKCEGEAFINYGSSEQLQKALRTFRGMSTIDSTADDVLLKYNDRPFIQVLRKYRAGKKDTGTYGIQWTQCWVTKPCKQEGWLHPGDGRLHCQFNQLEAETGRSSSSKPNGQNLPDEDEVRHCFIADEGMCIITADQSGAELRIIAEAAQAQSWIKAFALKQDVHSVSTEILYPEKWPSVALPDCAYYALGEDGNPQRKQCGCPEHKKMRKATKAINFLLCYGGGPDALADALGITVDAAKELMALHESRFPDVWNYLARSGEAAKRDKESRDMYGRRRLFLEPTWETAKEWYKEYNADRLGLNDEEKEASLFAFKSKELREPTDEEEFALTHRAPTDSEIRQGMKGMYSSIARRGKNHRIQGTNASIMKRAMGCGFDKDGKGYLFHLLPQYNAQILSMVHDELIVQAPKEHGEAVAQLIGDAFKRAAAEVMTSVAMEFDYHIADHWMK